MTLGKRIRKLRKEHEWTLKQLAKKIGVHRETLREWEIDLHEPSLISLLCLADVFNLSLDELVGRKFEQCRKT